MSLLVNLPFGRVFRQRATSRASSNAPARAAAAPVTGPGAPSPQRCSESGSSAPGRQRPNGKGLPAAAPMPAVAGSFAADEGSSMDLEARRIAEKTFVRDNDTKVAEHWYLIDTAWLGAWKSFVSRGGPLPGPIRTDVLMDPRTGRPRPGKRAIDHYRGVNAIVWEFWSSRYGAGPPVRRRKLDLYAPALPEDFGIAGERWSEVSLTQAEYLLGGEQQQSQQPQKRPRQPGYADQALSRSGGPATRPRGHQAASGPRRPVADVVNSSIIGDDSSPKVFFVPEAQACVVSQPPDGSCLFHALSYGLDDGSDASSLRREIGEYIARNAEMKIAGTALKDWVEFDSGGGVDDYAADIADMATGSWGGGIELEAIARLKCVNVHVYESGPGGFYRIGCFDAVDVEPERHEVINVLYRERGRGCEHYDALIVGEASGEWVPRLARCSELGAPGGA